MLDFLAVYSRYTGQALSAILAASLERYNLMLKLISITTDNASNNKTLYKTL
jgi:hypothetical protein